MDEMPPQRDVTLRFFAEPGDVNFLGKAFGGAVMKWIDLAGYAAATGWCGRTCVTAYVGGIRFIKPISIGHMVELHARLIHTGRTSMHISVDVRSRDPRGGAWTKTTHCVIVFVAVDDAGAPVPVPRWQPVSEEDLALQRYALKLFDLSKQVEGEMRQYLSS
jgi:acyl-CoA hydrolase